MCKVISSKFCEEGIVSIDNYCGMYDTIRTVNVSEHDVSKGFRTIFRCDTKIVNREENRILSCSRER